MKNEKTFVLKIVSLCGIFTIGIHFISFLYTIQSNLAYEKKLSPMYNKPISTIEWLKNNHQFFPIFLYIILFITCVLVYIIVKIKEPHTYDDGLGNKSLEKKIVGSILIMMSFLNLPNIYTSIRIYLRYKSSIYYRNEEATVEGAIFYVYKRYAIGSIIPFILFIGLGILLFYWGAKKSKQYLDN